ncbi:MAG: putative PDDEXK endonuclease [Panacagrimonas sp.]
MSGAHSRRKGADGEREVARLVLELLGVSMRRRLTQYQAGGFDLEPADGDPLLSRLAIEVKRAHRATQATVARWWRQTCEQAGDREPVLWFRGDGEDWRVVCRLDVSGQCIEPILTAADWAALTRAAT